MLTSTCVRDCYAHIMCILPMYASPHVHYSNNDIRTPNGASPHPPYTHSSSAADNPLCSVDYPHRAVLHACTTRIQNVDFGERKGVSFRPYLRGAQIHLQTPIIIIIIGLRKYECAKEVAGSERPADGRPHQSRTPACPRKSTPQYYLRLRIYDPKSLKHTHSHL